MNLFRKKPKININAEFDIENKRVFCIERLLNGQTIIAFTMYNEIHEWHIYTTDRQHLIFVDRFRRKLVKERHERKQEELKTHV
jgi:hypothetical protein